MAKKAKKQHDDVPGAALVAAVKAGNLEKVKELIAGGAEVSDMPDEGTALAAAAEGGDGRIVAALLEAGADPDFGGLSVPIATAAWKGHLAVVLQLIKAGADVNAQEEEGNTALMAAARQGRLDIVKALVGGGANAKLEDSDGSSAIYDGRKHPDVVEFLKPLSTEEQIASLSPPKESKASVSDVKARDREGRTSFYHAVHGRDLPLAKKLLAAGANINSVDQFGATPFLSVLGNKPKDLAMLKWLAASGADIHAKDAYGRNYLSLVDRYLPPDGIGEPEEREALRATLVEIGLISESGAQLVKLAGEGDLDEVKKMLASGADVNGTDEQERTPLWMAVSRQHPEVAAWLLQTGAKPSQPIGSDGEIDTQFGGRLIPCTKCKKPTMAMTVIRTCRACGNTFDMRKLPAQPPDDRELTFCWANGWSPLMAAARLNDIPMAKLLLDAKAKIDVGKGDATPLMCACSWDHVEMAKFLIERGAKVNAVCEEDSASSEDNMTAVGIAGKAGNMELLELLWANGAKTENQGVARLVEAAGSGDLKRVAALIKAGVDVNGLDPFSNHTPVYAASHAGQPEVLKALLKAGASVAQPKRSLSALFIAASGIGEGLERKTKTKADVPRYAETMKILIDAGDRVKVSVWGQTPLDFVKQARCKPLIELLEAAAANEKPAPKAKKSK